MLCEGIKLAPFNERFILWALGVTLFGHINAFMSISYFDQIIIFWTMLLGMIAAISAIPLYSNTANFTGEHF